MEHDNIITDQTIAAMILSTLTVTEIFDRVIDAFDLRATYPELDDDCIDDIAGDYVRTMRRFCSEHS